MAVFMLWQTLSIYFQLEDISQRSLGQREFSLDTDGKRLEHFYQDSCQSDRKAPKIISRGLEVSQNLVVTRITSKWIEALVFC